MLYMLPRSLETLPVNERQISELYVASAPSRYSAIREKTMIKIRETSGNSSTFGQTGGGLNTMQFSIAQQQRWLDLQSANLIFTLTGAGTAANTLAVLESVYSMFAGILLSSGETIEQVSQDLGSYIAYEAYRTQSPESSNYNTPFIYDWRNVETYSAVSSDSNVGQGWVLGKTSIVNNFLQYQTALSSTGGGLFVSIPLTFISRFCRVNKLWCGDVQLFLQLQLEKSAGAALFGIGSVTYGDITCSNIFIAMNSYRLSDEVHNILVNLMQHGNKPVPYAFDAITPYPANVTLTTSNANADITFNVSNNYVKQLSLLARQTANLNDPSLLKQAFPLVVTTSATERIGLKINVNGITMPELPIDYVNELWDMSRECWGMSKDIDAYGSTNLGNYLSTTVDLALQTSAGDLDTQPARFGIDVPTAQYQQGDFGALTGMLLSASVAPVSFRGSWKGSAAAYQFMLWVTSLRIASIQNGKVVVSQV